MWKLTSCSSSYQLGSLITMTPVIKLSSERLATTQYAHDAGSSLSVAVRVVGMAHLLIILRAVQQTGGLCNDTLPVDSDQPDCPSGDRLGSLSSLAYDQHRFAQGRRLLLHATGVGNNEIRSIHQVDKRQIIDRFYEMDVAECTAAEKPLDWFLNIGIEVNRIDLYFALFE